MCLERSSLAKVGSFDDINFEQAFEAITHSVDYFQSTLDFLSISYAWATPSPLSNTDPPLRDRDFNAAAWHTGSDPG